MVSFELLHRLQRYRPLVTLSDIVFSATCCYFLANKLCVDDICGAYRLKAVVKMVFVVLRDEPIFRECILDGSVGAAVTLSEDEQIAVGRVIAPMLFPPPSTNNSNSKPSSSSSSSVKSSSSSSSLLLHSGGDTEKERDGDQRVATLLAIAAEVVSYPPSLLPTLLHLIPSPSTHNHFLLTIHYLPQSTLSTTLFPADHPFYPNPLFLSILPDHPFTIQPLSTHPPSHHL